LNPGSNGANSADPGESTQFAASRYTQIAADQIFTPSDDPQPLRTPAPPVDPLGSQTDFTAETDRAGASPQQGSGSDRTDALGGAAANSDASLTPVLNGSSGFDQNGSGNGGAGSRHGQPAADQTTPAIEATRPSQTTPGAAINATSATPAQQILDGIQRAAPLESSDAAQTTQQDLQPSLDSGQPLKTMTLTLSPANLGSVGVELSFKSGKLGVKLQVQETGTAELLRQDGSLEKLLQSAGYSVQSLSIHVLPQSSHTPQATAQSATNGQASSDMSQTGGGRRQNNSQQNNGQAAERYQDQRPDYARTEDLRSGNSLYI
jgi:hypothetical protein